MSFYLIIILAIVVVVLLWRQLELQSRLRQLSDTVAAEPENDRATSTDLARKEEMLHVASSAVHNIGNAVTVAKLSLNELQQLSADEGFEAFDLILEEMLPELDRQRTKGNAQSFLSNDPQGAEYLESLRRLLEHLRQKAHQQRRATTALDQKLSHISEIIELQQRLSSGMGEQKLTQVESLIDDAALMLSESAIRHHVSVHRDYGETPAVHVDGLMVTQVFINLIKNAIEALDDGDTDDRQLQIHTKLTEEAGQRMVVCELADNGPGIAARDSERIFDFGYTTKQDGQGSGVGLHFCRRSVEQHGGRLSVRSTMGQGATFVVELPAYEAAHG